MKNNKQKRNSLIKPFLILSMIIAFGLTGVLIYESGFSLEVNLNGTVVGYAKNTEVVESALELTEDTVLTTYGEEAYFEKEVVTERVRGHKEDVQEADVLSDAISGVIAIYKPASVIMVDKQETVIVESDKVANSLLEEILKPYEAVDKDSKLLDVYFVQDVEVITKDVLVQDILSYDLITSPFRVNSAKPFIKQLTEKNSEYEIQSLLDSNEETLLVASTDTGVSAPRLDNSENLESKGLKLDVIVETEEIELVEIDFETVKEDDDSIFEGETKVTQKGVEGEETITNKVTYINGKKDSTEEVSKEVTTEPTDKLVAVGTKKRPVATPSYSAPTSYNSGSSSAIVNEAWRQVNNRVPYVSLGNSPAGFDCSGLTQYVLRQSGINLPHSATGQSGYGVAVSRADLQPGDLVFFGGGAGGGIGHVGIYIGNGNMIHAPVPGQNVSVTSINYAYFSARFVTARRLV